MHRRYWQSMMAGAALCAIVALVSLTGPIGSAVAEETSDLDMNKVFRCAASDASGIQACTRARELILGNCTTCHSFVPIVMQQFDKKRLDGLLARHRPRVPQLSDAQVGEIKAYLLANFNSKFPPPPLPEELRKLWLPY